jgi:hypothetical protein
MITESTSPSLYIDWGKNEPGMTLQRRNGKDWVNYKVDGKVVKSPVDIDTLPPGRYSSKAGGTAKVIWEKVNDH